MLQSPPSWRRGLKQVTAAKYINEPNVASFLEAWIETIFSTDYSHSIRVASFLEAWIETPTQSMTFCRIVSPPSWRCGLK